jgi:hypothetical protein
MFLTKKVLKLQQLQHYSSLWKINFNRYFQQKTWRIPIKKPTTSPLLISYGKSLYNILHRCSPQKSPIFWTKKSHCKAAELYHEVVHSRDGVPSSMVHSAEPLSSSSASVWGPGLSRTRPCSTPHCISSSTSHTGDSIAVDKTTVVPVVAAVATTTAKKG